MGVDLTLAPLMAPGFWCSHDKIEVGMTFELQEAISELELIDIPEPLVCYFARNEDGDPCYGPVLKTPYDERMKFTTVSELLKVKDHKHVKDNWPTAAVWAYLAEMPLDWPIVLYWH